MRGINNYYMRDRIISLCKISEEYANDDLKLIAKIWEQEGWDYDQGLYWNLKRVSKPETIRRTRQKLQEEGRIWVNGNVSDVRYKEYKRIKGECL